MFRLFICGIVFSSTISHTQILCYSDTLTTDFPLYYIAVLSNFKGLRGDLFSFL